MRSVSTSIAIAGSSCISSAAAFASPSALVPWARSNTGADANAPRARRRGADLLELRMGLILYGSPGSRSPLVNWAAEELNLEVAQGDLSRNPHPFGQIPCLTDDVDVVVFESGAILAYLQSKADRGKAVDAARSAAVTSWIAWANASLDPICFLETPEGKVYDTGLRSPNRRIDKLNDILGDAPHLVSGGFSLADVAVASYLLYVLQFFPDVELYSRWPHLVRYMRECAERDGYGRAFGGRVQGVCVDKLKEMENGDGDGKEKKLFGVF